MTEEGVEVRCKHCGQDSGWYRNVEVTGTGWSDVTVTGHPDGSVSQETDSFVQDIDYDSYMKHQAEFGCVNCQKESANIEDLVEVVEENLDPVLWRQLHPIPGQLRLDA